MVLYMEKWGFPVESFFQPSVTEEESGKLYEILDKVDVLAKQYNLTYFLYGGSLLGSYRHHRHIPWDDDIDLMFNLSQKPQILAAFQTLEPDYKVHFYGDMYTKRLWKLYAISGDSILFHRWNWPFIDVCFFDENNTHIWDNDVNFMSTFIWPKTEVFPLTERLFSSKMYPVPCDTEQFLSRNYDMSKCQSNVYSHRIELPVPYFIVRDVLCVRLKHFIPFVERRQNGQETVETLKLGTWEIHSIKVNAQCGANRIAN